MTVGRFPRAEEKANNKAALLQQIAACFAQTSWKAGAGQPERQQRLRGNERDIAAARRECERRAEELKRLKDTLTMEKSKHEAVAMERARELQRAQELRAEAAQDEAAGSENRRMLRQRRKESDKAFKTQAQMREFCRATTCVQWARPETGASSAGGLLAFRDRARALEAACRGAHAVAAAGDLWDAIEAFWEADPADDPDVPEAGMPI